MFSQRIIDDVPRIIDHDFLRPIAQELQPSLIAGLGLGEQNAAERARAYIAEDESITSLRMALEQRHTRLESIQARLHSFGT